MFYRIKEKISFSSIYNLLCFESVNVDRTCLINCCALVISSHVIVYVCECACLHASGWPGRGPLSDASEKRISGETKTSETHPATTPDFPCIDRSKESQLTRPDDPKTN